MIENNMVPGIPGRFRFFLAAGLGVAATFPGEDSVGSPEADEEFSKSAGMSTAKKQKRILKSRGVKKKIQSIYLFQMFWERGGQQFLLS